MNFSSRTLESLLPISDIILLEALVLGFLFTGGLLLALLLLTGKLQWMREGFRALCKASPQVLIVGGILALFPVYFLGVITNQVADIWIDQPSWYHLGLKSLWNHYGDDKTDDRIKCARYSHVFDCGKAFCQKCKEVKCPAKVNEWYHEITNHIVLMKNDKFRRYILYSQKQVNVARLWSFVSFFVLVACLARLVFLFGKAAWAWRRADPPDNPGRSDLRIVLIVAGVVIVMYFVGATVWARAEEETSTKVWRFAKSFPEKVSWSGSNVDKCSLAISSRPKK